MIDNPLRRTSSSDSLSLQWHDNEQLKHWSELRAKSAFHDHLYWQFPLVSRGWCSLKRAFDATSKWRSRKCSTHVHQHNEPVTPVLLRLPDTPGCSCCQRSRIGSRNRLRHKRLESGQLHFSL